MVDPRLVIYIKSQLSKGSLEQIRPILISKGWQDYQINQAMKLATQQTNPAVRRVEQQITPNTTQTPSSYQKPVEKSSDLRILLVLGLILTAGGILTLIILTVKEIIA